MFLPAYTASGFSTSPDKTLPVGIGSSIFSLTESREIDKSVASLAAICLTSTDWYLMVAPLRSRCDNSSSLPLRTRVLPPRPMIKIYSATVKTGSSTELFCFSQPRFIRRQRPTKSILRPKTGVL